MSLRKREIVECLRLNYNELTKGSSKLEVIMSNKALFDEPLDFMEVVHMVKPGVAATVLDTSEGAVMLHVYHGRTGRASTGHVYISDQTGTR